MIKTYSELLYENSAYANAKTKIARLVKDGALYEIRRGIYETDKNVNPMYLSSAIYSPSYISFQTALSYYGIIPERTMKITSATTKKNKRKSYKNAFGEYLYQDIPASAFNAGVIDYSNEQYPYLIASKEKAICDMLYIESPVSNMKELETLMFANLRFDEDAFKELDFNKLISIAELYKSTNTKMLIKYVRKNYAKWCYKRIVI